MRGNYDVILILGGGSDADSNLDEHARDKLDYAVKLSQQYQPKAIIVSGGYSYKLPIAPPITEAQAMKSYLASRGVAESSILLEEDSKDTLGNIYFSKVNVLSPHSWTNVLVVASVNHSLQRVDYLLKKILGPEYNYEITAQKTNDDNLNKKREEKSLQLTRLLLDNIENGDDRAVHDVMMEKHVAYSKTPELSEDQIMQFFDEKKKESL